MEWVVRYTEFITPETYRLAIAAFKKVYHGVPKDEAMAYVNHEHRSEAVVSLLQGLRNINGKVESGQLTVQVYDQ
jgi:hypothetical protein